MRLKCFATRGAISCVIISKQFKCMKFSNISLIYTTLLLDLPVEKQYMGWRFLFI